MFNNGNSLNKNNKRKKDEYEKELEKSMRDGK